MIFKLVFQTATDCRWYYRSDIFFVDILFFFIIYDTKLLYILKGEAVLGILIGANSGDLVISLYLHSRVLFLRYLDFLEINFEKLALFVQTLLT